MQDPKFTYLVKQYAAGRLTDLEWNELAGLLNSQEQETLSGELINTMPLSTENGPVDERMKRIISDILELDKTKSAITIHRTHFLKTTWFRYAAAIILIFGIGAYLWNNNLKVKTENSKTAKTDSSNEILPGGQKALLTLADGSTIILDSAANGQLATQGNSTIIKKDGIITYKSESLSSPFEKGGRSDARGEGTAGGFKNTMSTPRGGQYQLTLADGTKVWLNAASSITYPTAFTGNTREVFITGEAYFEVTKNAKQPFRVKTKNDQIEVLGTSFNVNAYEDEPIMKTSLAEGSIKIGTKVLQPGKAYINGNIVTTNIAQDLAWKNGVLDFNNRSINEVLRMIARWYDVDIVKLNTIPDEKIKGEISRDLNLSDVLAVLKAFDLQTELKGRQLMVKAK